MNKNKKGIKERQLKNKLKYRFEIDLLRTYNCEFLILHS